MPAPNPLAAALALALAATLAAGAARAEDGDCRRPMAEWQTKEAVAARAGELGLVTERMRIHDDCYQVRGRDGDGSRISLTLDPATLAVLAIDIRLRPGADATRYLPDARVPPARTPRRAQAASGSPTAPPR